jgi:hypothetical protein
MILFYCAFLFLAACQNPVTKAVRDIKYSGYEMVGIEKRDLLKRDISAAREDQKEASETFRDALTQLRTLYSMPESQLSRQYDGLRSSYEESDERAKDVRSSRAKMETVAQDLFKEWESEVKQIQTAELKSQSRSRLRESRARFAELDRSLISAERKMEPVLTKLKDHVLYLKHNLNAESLASLKTEHDRIGGDIESLIRDMNRSIDQADAFIKTLR